MKKIILQTIYICLLSSFFCSCKDDDLNPNVIIDIHDSISITPSQSIDVSQGRVLLHASTAAMFPCENAMLHYSQDNAGFITISFNHVHYQDCTNTAYNHAKANVDLGRLSIGSHNISLNLNDNEIINTGKILVSSNKYIFQMNTSYGISMTNNILHKIPEHTVWGAIQFENENEAESLFTDILDELMVDGYTSLSDGNYGHFNISEGSISSVVFNENKYDNYVFLIQHDNNLADIRSKIASIRSNYADVLNIFAASSDGSTL